MRRKALAIFFAILLSCSAGSAADNSKRGIPCKTPENASSCYWTHGQLAYYNGIPPYRLQETIRRDRIFGIYSGPSVDRGGADSRNPEFPLNIARAFAQSNLPHPADIQITGLFEVCPLEPEEAGIVRAACIESAKELIVAREE